MTQIDLTQILKDCPEGTTFYSPIYGSVTFKEISSDEDFPISVLVNHLSIRTFTRDGKFYLHNDAECQLFPSKDNRDWSTFKVEQPQQFEPFEHVLVRNYDGQAWKISLYSYLRKGWANPHVCIEDCYNQCISYEGNEHLLGMNDKPKKGGIKGDFGTNGDEVVLPYNELQNKMKEE